MPLVTGDWQATAPFEVAYPEPEAGRHGEAWSGFKSETWPGGTVSTGPVPPSATGDELSALYSQALQTNAATSAGVSNLWSWVVAAWPFTLKGSLIFSYSWADRMIFSAWRVPAPDPLEQRAILEAGIRAANPDLRALEWEGNAAGSFTNHRITVNARATGVVYDNPSDQDARRNPHPFDSTNGSETSVRIMNPAALEAAASGSPALTPSELAYPTSVMMTNDPDYNREMQLHFNEEIGRLPALDGGVTSRTFAIDDALYARQLDTSSDPAVWFSFAAADWSVDGLFERGYPPPGTGFNLSVLGSLDYFTDYMPPRYRLTFFDPDEPPPDPEPTFSPAPPVRQWPRQDGLGPLGGPPRLDTASSSAQSGFRLGGPGSYY